MKKILATLVILVMVLPGALAVTYPEVLARQAPTTPGAPLGGVTNLHASDLEIMDLSVGAEQGDESVVTFRVRNPYVVEDGEELSIWQFLVSVPSSAGVTFLREETRISLPEWIIYDSDSCAGPEGLAGVVGQSCEVLVFEASFNRHLRPGGIATFTVQLEMDDSVAACTKIPINVYGVHIKKDPSLGYSHTGLAPSVPASGRTVTLVVDDLGDDPVVVEDASRFYDLDHNGHIDTVRVQFNKELDPLTVDKDDFTVKPSTAGLGSGNFVVKGATVKNPVGAVHPDVLCPPNSVVELELEEKDLLDTGDAPEVTFKERSGASRLDRYSERILHTISNQRVATQDGFEAVDAARPVLASALTYVFEDAHDAPLNDRVLLTFSEPVLAYNNPSCTGTSREVAANDILFIPWSESSQSYGAMPAGSAAASMRMEHRRDVDNNEPDNRHMWLILDQSSAFMPLSFENTEHRFKPHDSAVEREPNGDDVGDPQPHRFGVHPTTQFICDEALNRVWDHLEPGEVLGSNCPTIPPANLCQRDWFPRMEPLSVPSIIKVEGDISHDWLTVHLTGEAHLGACLKDPLHTYFTVVNGRGPQGIVAATFTRGSDRVHLKMDAPLTEADASGDPTYLRMQAGLFFHDMIEDWTRHQCTPSATVKDHHRDTLESREPWPMRTQDERIVDQTRPKVIRAWTLDRDGNGELDGVEFLWTEPVRDSTFKEGNPGSTAVTLDVEGHLDYRRVDIGSPNDDRLTIAMTSRAGLGYDTQRLPETDAIWRSVNNELVGMVMDLSQDPDIRDRTAGNWMGPETSTLKNDTSLHFTLYDRAPPRVMRAITLDRNENGRIDAYKLIFSEPILDTSFNAAHWRVIDMVSQPAYEYTVTGVVPNNAVNATARPFDPFVNDNVLILALSERPQTPGTLPFGDTGSPIRPPEVLYDPTRAPGGIEDMAGLPAALGGPNRMLAMDRGKVVEEDGARPVLIAALGCDATNRVAAFFSEAVGVRFNATEPLRGIRETDLFYGNTNPGGATGLQNDTVRHELGGTRLDAETKGLLAGQDFTNDFLQAQADRSRNETVSVIQELNGELRVLFERARLQRSADIFEPDAIEQLRVQRVTAGAVEIQFEIPEDPGCTDRGVVDYKVRVQNLAANSTRINPTTVDSVPVANAEDLEWWWYNETTERNITKTPLALLTDHKVGTGETLNVRIHGLLASTRYEITLQAVDRYNNVAPMADPVTINTTTDLTPPVKPNNFAITSPTHPKDGISKTPVPQFTWTKATDVESVFVRYVYALSSTSSQYQPSDLRDLVTLNNTVTIDAQKIGRFSSSPTGLAPANWFDGPKQWHFIVAACSGGGCTTLGNYSFKVDSPVNGTEIRTMHDGIETTVVYEEATSDAVITWTEPKQVPSGCSLDAVQVWRDDGAGYVNLGTFRKADQVYKDRNYRDTGRNASADAPYLVTYGCQDTVLTYFKQLGNNTGQFESVKVLGAGVYPEGRSPNSNDYPGSTASVEPKPFAPPWWVWVILAILVLAIVAGIILFARSQRGGEIWQDRTIDEATLQKPEGEEDEPDDAKPEAPVREIGGAYKPPNAAAQEAAAAEAGEGPTHDIKCPKCKQQFQATGTFPLKVTCPHCGTSGTLR